MTPAQFWVQEIERLVRDEREARASRQRARQSAVAESTAPRVSGAVPTRQTPKQTRPNVSSPAVKAPTGRVTGSGKASVMPTGLASSHDSPKGFATVAPKAARAPVILGAGKSLLDEEWRVKGGRGGQGQALGRAKVAVSFGAGGAVGIDARAAALSAGYSPAVLKVVSYAHGVTRATSTAQYVQRDGVQLETYDGRLLADHEAVAAEMKEWEQDFENRRESQDVVTMRLSLTGVPADEQEAALEQAVKAGFDGHRHAWRIEANDKGELTARVVVVLAGHDPSSHNEHGNRERERFKVLETKTGPKLVERYDTSIKQRIGAATGIEAGSISLAVGKPGHGTEAAAYRVGQLIEAGGARADTGERLGQAGQERTVARDWKGHLNSFQPRDTMHLVLSAKAGVNEEAFSRAVRGFLHEQFGDHKFAFGVHTDKAESASHIHAHAIIAVRSEEGQKLRTGPAILNAWREAYAAQAQAQGLKIVATRAMEQASSQSYGSKDRAIVQAADSPRAGREERDRAYARENANLVENARKRIETARTNPAKQPVTERQRLVVNASLSTWQQQLRADPTNNVAQENVFRLSIATYAGATIHRLDESRKGQTVAGTAAEMKDALRDINTEAVKHAATLSGDDKTAFMAQASKAMLQMAATVELKRAEEAGVTRLNPDSLRAVAGSATSKIIEQADRNAQAEAREAQSAERLAQDAERAARGTGGGEIDPTRLVETEAARVVAAQAQVVASRERAEASEAADAADRARLDPTQHLDRNAEDKSERLAALEREQRAEMERLKAERATLSQGDMQRGPRQRQ